MNPYRFAQSALCAAILTFVAGLRPDFAHAQDIVFHNEKVYQSANPQGDVVVKSELMLVNDQIRLLGSVAIYLGNSTPSRPAGWLAVRGVLWKWNGSSWGVCQNHVSWSYNAAAGFDSEIAKFDQSTFACGDGFYNFGAEGCAWADNAWRCGTSFSGSIFANVNDNPPILE